MLQKYRQKEIKAIIKIMPNSEMYQVNSLRFNVVLENERFKDETSSNVLSY